MISVPGYSNLQSIHQSARTLVYSATRAIDGEKVIMRQLRAELTSPDLVAQYRREFELLNTLDSIYVIKVIDLIDHNGSPILVTEDFSGQSLADFISEQTIELPEATSITRSIASALDYIHSKFIVHKDINPSNIIYDRSSGLLKLIDFGISLALSSNSLKPETNSILEGTLAYLSPEQTGRINRSVDYRADFYCLGATLYHLITGKLPFTSKDPLELIHGHIAKSPLPPEEQNPLIPKALSRITLKLLSKMPDDRYQSAYSLRQDLDLCLKLMADQTIDVAELDFEIALDDIAEQLNISERLLEREDALAMLRQALKSATNGGTEIIICTGEAGVGKSSLIRELEKDVIELGGFIVSGRHIPTSTQTPYSAVSKAFSDLIKQLLIRKDFPELKQKIRNALDGTEELMINLIPELSLVVESKTPDRQLSPLEAKRKLIHGIFALVRSISSQGRPLIFFLDNIHWIDSASIELFEPLFTRVQIPYIFLLGAYRINELSADNTTRIAFSKLAKSNQNIKLINLENLSVRGIATIISDSCFRSIEETTPFAEIIFEKTSGNPLAVKELLHSLHTRGILKFNRQHRDWEWDLETVSLEPPSESVIILLANHMQQLDVGTRNLLQIAACIGNEFDLDTLQSAAGLSYSETSARLSQAVKEGYLLYSPDKNQAEGKKLFYSFTHERIQQAAYSLLSSHQRKQIHSSIGRSFLESSQQDLDIFDIVNQLNNSFESLGNIGIDKNKLAKLNLSAGRKAKQGVAFQSSFKYFKTAIALFGQDIWDQYDLSLELHMEAAESAYLCGDHDQLDFLVKTSLEHARGILDKSKIQELKIKSLVAKGNLEQAIDSGHTALLLLDVKVPRISRLRTVRLLLKLLLHTAVMSRQADGAIKNMQDDKKLVAMRILMILCQAGYISGSPETPLHILKMTELSLKYGMAPESSFAYAMFGSLLISYLGAIDSGYRFGILALENLNETNLELHCKAITLTNNFIMFWKHHLEKSLEPLSQAYRIGMETGEIEFALIAGVTRSANAFILGHDLNILENDLANSNEEAKKFNQTPILNLGSIYQQAVHNLTSQNQLPWMLEGDIYDEKQLLKHVKNSDGVSSITNLYILKLFLAVLFNEPKHALKFARQARQSLDSVISSPAIPFFTIYESLACVANLGVVSYKERLRLRVRLKLNQKQLRKWSHHAPENILHGFHLIEAERAKYNGNTTSAMDHYELAIGYASKYGFLKEQGFANELTGRFYLDSGKHDLALFYLERAKTIYRRWGATTKVYWLNEEFTDLYDSDQSNQAGRIPTTTNGLQDFGGNQIPTYGNSLDLGSVIKASQALSGEIVLENLLERLMQVSLENAGAHSASLILTRNDQLVVEINTWYSGSTVEHSLDNIPLQKADHLPVSVIQFVARTQKDLVLNDVLNENIFAQDEYIINSQPKSILCIPILSKSHLTGILYLENLHATHAFSQNRVTILKLLASQSAIAIENAKLYQQLNDSRNKYLSLYRNAIEGIYEIDTNGFLTNINPAASELLGFDSPEEILDSNRNPIYDSFVSTSDFERMQSELLTRGRVVGFETQLFKNDSSTVWVSLSAQMVYDNDTAESHVEGSIIDISERSLREEAVKARIIAESATETKSQFLANMSHEIRTPMNAIIGYTDLALQTNLTPEQDNYLKTIKNSSKHLLRVVNDILDISKVESGKLELQKSVFRLKDLFTDLKNLFTLAAGEKGLELILPDEDEYSKNSYVGDSVRIGQVLINLVGNALKFTPEGKIQVELEVLNFSDDRACFNFTVVDTGVGIDESQLEKIFESFTQGNITTSDGGTGLGLSISRRLVEMMDGHIHATSILEQGSEFYFSVIVEQWNETPVDQDSTTTSAKVIENFAGKHILLVEDNRINRELAREVLKKAGFTVTVAKDGDQAIRKLEQDKYFAILMDIRMPVLDGMQAIEIIRGRDDLKDATVIALSAGALDTQVKAALEAGFDHYLSKPVDFSQLLKLLGNISGVEKPDEENARLPGKEIRGIDFGRALQNHDHNQALLNELTSTFVEIYGQCDEELNSFVSSGDLHKAERLVHNVAGVSGSFGATKLMDVSREIEHALEDSSAELKPLLITFSKELVNFVLAIEQLHGEQVA